MRARILALAVAASSLVSCDDLPEPAPFVASGFTSGATTIDIHFDPFEFTGSSSAGNCSPFFVDVRTPGNGRFEKPELPSTDMTRYRAVRAEPGGNGGRGIEIVLQAPDEPDVTAVLTPTIQPDGWVWLDIDSGFEEFDVAFVGSCFALEPGVHVVGGGERFDGADLLGRVTPLYFAAPRPSASGTNEAHAPVPFFATSDGTAVLVTTERVGAFDVAVTTPGALELRFQGPRLPLAIRHGTIEDNVAALARRMGLPPEPPLWVLAPMQWRNALEPVVENNVVTVSGTDELLADVEQMRSLGFPASTVWFDAPWETGYNTFVPNETQLPDFAGTLDLLALRGFNAIVWATEHLNVSDDSDQMIGMPESATDALALQFEDSGFVVSTESGEPFEFPWGRGQGTFVDFTHPDACAAYRDLMRPLIAGGIVGFKLDYGETMRPDVLGLENDLPRFFDGTTTQVQHTRYASLYHQCFIDELQAVHPDDWFVITRTGGIYDSHRGTTIWPGDLDVSWLEAGADTDDGPAVGGLPAAVQGYLSLAMSGYPLYGSDVGGYRGNPPSPELFVRWAQFGAVSTVMQVGGGASFAPWDVGYEEVVDDIVAAARLHMNLWPMWRQWLADASATGAPVVVPVGVAAPEDARAWNDRHTFVLGGVLLAAPVVLEGATTRTLFVPEGSWVAFDGTALGDEVLEGPAEVTVDAPLNRLPLFARQGAVLELGNPALQSLLPTASSIDGGINFLGTTTLLEVVVP